jgi:hypothetical protein
MAETMGKKSLKQIIDGVVKIQPKKEKTIVLKPT